MLIFFFEPNYGEISFDGEDKEEKLKAFFEQWCDALGTMMGPELRDDDKKPEVRIVVETESITARFEHLNEKNKKALFKNKNMKVNYEEENKSLKENHHSKQIISLTQQPLDIEITEEIDVFLH